VREFASRFSTRARKSREYRASFECSRWYRRSQLWNRKFCTEMWPIVQQRRPWRDGEWPLRRRSSSYSFALLRSTTRVCAKRLLLLFLLLLFLFLLLPLVMHRCIGIFPREKWPFNCHAGCRLTNRVSLTSLSFPRGFSTDERNTRCQSMTRCRLSRNRLVEKYCNIKKLKSSKVHLIVVYKIQKVYLRKSKHLKIWKYFK